MQGFGPLFRMIADRVHALLADRGYDADAIRAEIAEMKKRTAELQALRMKPTREERPSRRTLKAQRAEINQQLAQVQTDIAARGGPAPPPPAAAPPPFFLKN